MLAATWLWSTRSPRAAASFPLISRASRSRDASARSRLAARYGRPRGGGYFSRARSFRSRKDRAPTTPRLRPTRSSSRTWGSPAPSAVPTGSPRTGRCSNTRTPRGRCARSSRRGRRRAAAPPSLSPPYPRRTRGRPAPAAAAAGAAAVEPRVRAPGVVTRGVPRGVPVARRVSPAGGAAGRGRGAGRAVALRRARGPRWGGACRAVPRT